MEPVRNIDLRLAAQLAALELVVVELAQEVQARVPQFATNLRRPSNLLSRWRENRRARDGILAAIGMQSIPDEPEVSDMLTAELQAAWSRLVQRIASPF